MRRRGTISQFLLIVSGLVALALGFPRIPSSLGQNPPPPSQQTGPAPVTLHVTARLVQVNVIVQDKDGNPVTGLTKNDFTLMDKGQPQRISLFTELASRVSPAPAAPNVFSNRLEQNSGGPTAVTVILLDAVNTNFRDIAYAREQVLKFVRQAQPQDEIAIYLHTIEKLYVLHDFTNDKATLIRVMGGVKREKGSTDAAIQSADAANVRLNKQLNDAFAESNRFYKGTPEDRADTTYQGMKFIANRVVNIPGHKNLVWVSGSFPLQRGFGNAVGGRSQRQDFSPTLSAIAQVLSNANVSVYPVDARGLIGPNVMSVVSGRTTNVSAAAPPRGPFDTMNWLAEGTGGRAFYNSNDISGSIRKSIDDSRDSYVLGYYPDHNSWDGKFREVKVTVNRPKVQLRYRSGYFATPLGGNDSQSTKQLMSDVLRSPLQMIDLGLDVQATPIDTAGPRQIRAQIRVDGTQLHFEPNGNRWTDSLEVLWVELTADGRIVGRGGNTLGLKPPKGGYDEILAKGLNFTERVSVKNEAVEVRLVVRDIGSGAIGSVNIPVSQVFGTVPPNSPAK